MRWSRRLVGATRDAEGRLLEADRRPVLVLDAPGGDVELQDTDGRDDGAWSPISRVRSTCQVPSSSSCSRPLRNCLTAAIGGHGEPEVLGGEGRQPG
jgi:hypothetical protein